LNQMANNTLGSGSEANNLVPKSAEELKAVERGNVQFDCRKECNNLSASIETESQNSEDTELELENNPNAKGILAELEDTTPARITLSNSESPTSSTTTLVGYTSFGSADAESFSKKLRAEIQKDVHVWQKANGKESSGNEKLAQVGGFFSAPDKRIDRLQSNFGEAFEGNELNVDKLNSLVDRLLNDPAKLEKLYGEMQPLKMEEAEDVKKYEKLKETIPNDAWEKEDGKKSSAEQYLEEVKGGYDGDFDQWDEAQPRSGFENIIRSLKKLLGPILGKLGGWAKDILPEGVINFFGGGEKEKTEIQETLEQETKQNKNWLEWGQEGNEGLSTDFDKFYQGYNGLFSFLDKPAGDNTTSAEKKSAQMNVSPTEFKGWQKMLDAEGDKLTPVLTWASKLEGSKGISIEIFREVVKNSGQFEVEGEKLKFTPKGVDGKPDEKNAEMISKWSDADIGILLGTIDSSAVNPDKFAGGLLELRDDIPENLWGGYKVSERDRVNFFKYEGDLFDDNSLLDVFHEEGVDAGDEYINENGEVMKANEDMEAMEVNGTGWSGDLKFENVKAFFTWLGNQNDKNEQ
jgi:hypothetical protein